MTNQLAAVETGVIGIEILGFSVLAIMPTPETDRALEALPRQSRGNFPAQTRTVSGRGATVQNTTAVTGTEVDVKVLDVRTTLTKK